MLELADRVRLQEFVDKCIPVEDGFLMPLTDEEREELSLLLLKALYEMERGL